VSREHDVLINSAATPPAITSLTVAASPTGDAALLDWAGYNQWAVGDVQRFDIYYFTSPVTEIPSGAVPLLSAGGGVNSVAVGSLTPGKDHFFAVVPVDGLGNFDPAVHYAAAYVVSPQVVSREMSLYIGQ